MHATVQAIEWLSHTIDNSKCCEVIKQWFSTSLKLRPFNTDMVTTTIYGGDPNHNIISTATP